MRYALVIGEKGRKSAAVLQIAVDLALRGLRVAGFAQRTFEEGPGRKAIEVMRLRDGTTLPLARTTADPGCATAVCSFAFDSASFEETGRWIEADVAEADVVVLDGVGKLELAGAGHRAAIEYALRAGPPVILAVREDNLVYAFEAFALEEPLASYGTSEGAAALERFLDAVTQVARQPCLGTQAAARPRRPKTVASTS